MATYNALNAEALYDKYADMLYRIALSHTQCNEDAMDVVQDVFLKFFSSKQNIVNEEHCKAWFIRSTINRSHDITRRRKIRSYISFDEISEIPAEDDISPDVREMLNILPEKLKSVMVLHYLEGFSVEEVANILDISVSAVKTRLNRARELVKLKYKKEEFYE